MQRVSTVRGKIVSAAGALSLLAGVSACGDDGGNGSRIDGGNGTDAALPDAGTATDGAPGDAADPTTLRSGTIAVTEVSLTNPNLPVAGPVTGAAVSINYTDLTTITVAPTYDPTGEGVVQFGDCAVWVYDVGSDKEPARVDEGPITISGGLSPIGTCVFSPAAQDYVCPFAMGTVSEGATLAFSPANGTVTITWPDDEFTDKDVRGMFVRLSGLASEGNNGVFPILNKPADNILVVANPKGTSEVVAAGSAPAYTVLAGAGPTPAARAFLDGDTQITVQKGDGSVVSQFQASVVASGNGLTLAANSAQPHQFPATALQELTFACGGAGGECGPVPDDAIYGFVLSGRTTDGDISGLKTGFDVIAMPDPVSQYAVFQCRGRIHEDALTIPRAALETILSTRPNRVEIRLLRVTADLGQPPSSVVVGHGLVGYTDTNLSPGQ